MRYDLIIFDLDGTVLNTKGGLAYAVNEARKECGLPPQEKDFIISLVGNGTRKLIERSLAGEKNADELFEKVLSTYQKIYEENCLYDTYPYDGVTKMLQTLKSNGIKLAVVTNKPDKPAKILIRENFGDLIDEVHGNVDSVPVKPDPTFVFMTMENQGVKPQRTCYVGDSDVDIKTARAAGIDVISVDWGFKTREFLTENGAGVLCSDPGELLEQVCS